MEQATIRQRLHELVEGGDERLLHILYAVANEYNAGAEQDELTELQRRTKSRLAGESRTYSWDEAKEIITAKSSS